MKSLHLFLFAFLLVALHTACSSDPEVLKWAEADNIVENMEEITFPDREYNILDFGAKGDSVFVNTQIINDLVKKCSSEGGGTVTVPEGAFFTGPIHFEDNVNLLLEEGAILLFSTNPQDYLPVVETSWEGMLCYNYSPLIYANGKTNVAITGKGKIDGMASTENWWKWKGRKEYGWKEGEPSQLDSAGVPLLNKYNDERVPVEERLFGEGHYLRPHFVQFFECTNVLIEGITVENSPFWVLHPIFSENVIVRRVTVNSHGTNNDGCDPESCKNVLIEECLFNTGDDCIALKSGRNADGRTIGKPIENVIIRNCLMKDGHGGVVIGSEISGGARNIFAENCKMSSPELDRAIRIKTNSNRGGVIQDIYIRNIEVGEVKEAVVKINCHYDIKKEGDGDYPPEVKNVYITNIVSEKSEYALHMTGLEDYNAIHDIHISECQFKGVERENHIEHVENLNLQAMYIGVDEE